jgi:hypothetical protein
MMIDQYYDPAYLNRLDLWLANDVSDDTIATAERIDIPACVVSMGGGDCISNDRSECKASLMCEPWIDHGHMVIGYQRNASHPDELSGIVRIGVLSQRYDWSMSHYEQLRRLSDRYPGGRYFRMFNGSPWNPDCDALILWGHLLLKSEVRQRDGAIVPSLLARMLLGQTVTWPPVPAT